jgi:glutathione S-transferase
MAEGLTLYSMPSSGNSYKVRLLLSMLERPYTHVTVEYGTDGLERAKSGGKLPFGKAPALELADGRGLAESNAILCWLAEGTPYLPAEPFPRARILAWMFFEQNRIETTVAVRGALLLYPHRAADATHERLAALLASGEAAMRVVEDRLADADWLEGAGPSVADIALYGYLCTADTRSGYDLGAFPGIAAWRDRVAALPGHVALEAIPE